jgi:hypothetical protein
MLFSYEITVRMEKHKYDEHDDAGQELWEGEKPFPFHIECNNHLS